MRLYSSEQILARARKNNAEDIGRFFFNGMVMILKHHALWMLKKDWASALCESVAMFV